MSDVEVTEPPADVLVPLGQMEAERLDKRLRLMAGTTRENFEKVGRLLDEAKAGQVHAVLGFKSWTAYVADAVGGQLQLSRDSRAAMVAMLAGEGMSLRAISEATGVSKSTVANDLAQVSNSWTPEADSGVQVLDTSQEAAGDTNHAAAQPDRDDVVQSGPPAEHSSETVTGLDGKSYAKPPKPAPKPKADGAPQAPNPRKVVERIAPRIESMVAALDGLDPNEVDGDAIRDKVDIIRDSLGKITTFVDKVLPPKPAQPIVDDPARKPQIPTVLRRNVGQIIDLLNEVDGLRQDPRWEKAAERFKAEDHAAVGVAMTLVSDLAKALGGDVPVPAEDSPPPPAEPSIGERLRQGLDSATQVAEAPPKWSSPEVSTQVPKPGADGEQSAKPSPAAMPTRMAGVRDRKRTRGGDPA